MSSNTDTMITHLNEADFVEVDNNLFSVFLPYAVEDNFTGEKLYPNHSCFLKSEMNEALKKANEIFLSSGFRIHIWDAYRPFHVQEKLLSHTPDDKYIARPVRENGVIVSGSPHNRGQAIDLTLVTLDGEYTNMPSEFDDLSEKAWRTPESWTDETKSLMKLKEDTLTKFGFIPNPNEWWHYNFKGKKLYNALYDLPLPDIDHSTRDN